MMVRARPVRRPSAPHRIQISHQAVIGFNDRTGAVLVETGESHRDTLPCQSFAGSRHHISYASCISSALLRFPRAGERRSRGISIRCF
jgi:hypothetical protein